MYLYPRPYSALYPLCLFIVWTLFSLPGAAQSLPLPLLRALPALEQSGSAPLSADTSPAENEGPAPPQPTPGSSRVSLERSYLKDLVTDEKAIWTSPGRIGRSEAPWLIPLAATTAALIATDRRASRKFGYSEDRVEASRTLSRFGSGYTTVGAAGTLYLLGRVRHDDHLQEAGLLGSEAWIHSAIVAGGLKLATSRKRPDQGRGAGHFWRGGTSFPSGHAIGIWSFATVLAEEYRDRPAVRIGAYGLATVVSLSRFTGQNHFPSDVVVGSALGYLIGHYVVKRHAFRRPSGPGTNLPYGGRSKAKK